MIAHLPIWVSLLFGLAFIATLLLFYYSNNRPKKLLAGILAWALLQSILAYNGFYQITDSVPPRYALALIPPTLLIIYALLPKQRQSILEHRNNKLSTFLHTIRIPVEIVLLQLFLHDMIPELMTFEGRNFDILAGLTAPIVGFLYYKNKLSNQLMIVWNIICLGLIFFILINAILSTESVLQQFAFEQSNKGINYFPFILLPTVIVPIVIYTHISDILKLRNGR